MPPAADILQSLGLDRLIVPDSFTRAPGGTYRDAFGDHAVFAHANPLIALRQVIDAERPDAWRLVMKACGDASGRQLGAHLDARLAAAGQPALAALPLEACLALLERLLTARGWGRLLVDLSHVQQAVLVAHVEHSCFAEALAGSEGFADPLLAGVLRGFFQYLTKQSLDAEEIACVRAGSERCTFVITAPAHLAAVANRIGRDSAATIIDELVARAG